MDREDQLIGELIAARGLAQMLCITLVQKGIISQESAENLIMALLAQWTKVSNGEDQKLATWAAVATVRMGEFLAEFRELMGGVMQ